MELLLNEQSQTGVWTMEARIDGELLGNHHFELISSVKPEIKEDTRRPLGVPELYKEATEAVAGIERLNDQGAVQGTASGFFDEDGDFVTAFQNIDGAVGLRLVLPDGRRVPVDTVVGW